MEVEDVGVEKQKAVLILEGRKYIEKSQRDKHVNFLYVYSKKPCSFFYKK